MLYHLFNYLQESINLPGAGVFQFISFRAGMSMVISLLISMFFGKHLIRRLQILQIGEEIRELGLAGEESKKGTPTMGGIIILGAIVIPTLLFADLCNVYIILMLISTVWMGLIGFIDDYIKVFRKNKKGLAGKFKVIGQIGLGIIVGSVLYFNDDVYIKKEVPAEAAVSAPASIISETTDHDGETRYMAKLKAPVTTVPFVKSHEFDYSSVLFFMKHDSYKYGWIIFIPMVIFIITAVSNGANLTDGLDGLATGTSAIAASALGVFAYISGNIIFSNYLNIMYIPFVGELTIFIAALIGACIGFLWYNAYPAKVFMGDTGSLALGGIIAALAIIIRKELLIPVLCGIFLIENLSVIIQVTYFKYTKAKYGEGRRVFLMSPLHHHYQKLGMHEAKIVSRFWIVGLILAVFTFLTLKLR